MVEVCREVRGYALAMTCDRGFCGELRQQVIDTMDLPPDEVAAIAPLVTAEITR